MTEDCQTIIFNPEEVSRALRKLLPAGYVETDRENKSLARVCAGGLALTVGNHLDCDDPPMREARATCGELGKLAGRTTGTNTPASTQPREHLTLNATDWPEYNLSPHRDSCRLQTKL